MKRVLKYGTGQEIPEGAVYLCTLRNGDMGDEECRKFVWHYFLVEVKDGN